MEVGERLACGMLYYSRATARQKAMGEALFEGSCRAAHIRDPKGPLIGSLIL